LCVCVCVCVFVCVCVCVCESSVCVCILVCQQVIISLFSFFWRAGAFGRLGLVELSSIIGNFCDRHGELLWLSLETVMRGASVLVGVRESFISMVLLASPVSGKLA